MSRIMRKLNQWTAHLFDLPQDIVSDVPRVSLIGNRKLFVENHRGIVHFSNENMRLSLAKGELEVTGSELVIRGIWTEEICIEGYITEVKVHGMEDAKP
ncbi:MULTISPECIES: sporulation protein YqfC [Paenibacillus]|uniref:Sporulation protein YqfC n=1 Tax=Paenibacillus arenosi TaxID=2774142 RepID=A0ABR9ARH6_9BACL|nr:MULTISPECIES: sporulation protein YqfC [Paenibacillus]MBD8496712.1 sporulation protein YqfC [Paenibacillus arenosi]